MFGPYLLIFSLFWAQKEKRLFDHGLIIHITTYYRLYLMRGQVTAIKEHGEIID
jgi:hypothetical protein